MFITRHYNDGTTQQWQQQSQPTEGLTSQEAKKSILNNHITGFIVPGCCGFAAAGAKVLAVSLVVSAIFSFVIVKVVDWFKESLSDDSIYFCREKYPGREPSDCPNYYPPDPLDGIDLALVWSTPAAIAVFINILANIAACATHGSDLRKEHNANIRRLTEGLPEEGGACLNSIEMQRIESYLFPTDFPLLSIRQMDAIKGRVSQNTKHLTDSQRAKWAFLSRVVWVCDDLVEKFRQQDTITLLRNDASLLELVIMKLTKEQLQHQDVEKALRMIVFPLEDETEEVRPHISEFLERVRTGTATIEREIGTERLEGTTAAEQEAKTKREKALQAAQETVELRSWILFCQTNR